MLAKQGDHKEGRKPLVFCSRKLLEIVGMRLEKDKTEGQSAGVEMRGMTSIQNTADMLLFGL